MKTIEHPSPILIHNLEELTNLCKAAGAAVSTIISSADKVVVYYTDPRTNGCQCADFVDELHIRHVKNARLLITVFPE